jgi:hypothetical protein
MKRWALAAGLLAATAMQAWAAEVDESGPSPQPRGAYEEPRAPKAAPPPAFRYDEDDLDDRLPPAGKKYSGPAPHGRTCARSEDVREHLTRFGWNDFHAGQLNGDEVTMRARRPSGRLFELTLDRCSGEIVEVQPLEPRRFGFFAHRERPWYDRDYGFRPHDLDRPYGYGPRRWWYRDY